MPCFHPRKLYSNPKSTTGYSFHPPTYSDIYIKNPPHIIVTCKQCTGCRSEYSRQWAMRIQCEHELLNNSSFITLTYNNENLPKNKTLVKKHFQDFMKRLRKHYSPQKIRFFHCGEYGEKNGKRPHYHAILFNCSFNDAKQLPNYKLLKQSAQLTKIWGKGHASIGEVTFQSAAYVAGYVQKKINGKQKEAHYAIIDKTTGEYHGQLQQEYSTMSRKPGIAGDWFTKFKTDVYPSDNFHINGHECSPPKYFDYLLELEDKEQLDLLKQKRKQEMKSTEHLRTSEALAQAKLHHQARMSLYKRGKL